MKSFCIEVRLDEVSLIQLIKDGFKNMESYNIHLKYDEEKVSNLLLLKFNIECEEDSIEFINREISKIILNCLFKEYYKGYVNKILKTQYPLLDNNDILIIKEKIEANISETYSIEREVVKDKILNKIYDYVKENQEIKLAGFITFRLNEFVTYIEDEIEKLVDEVFMEREYNEFVKLLKYFVDIQDPKMGKINVIPENFKYKLYDEYFNPINTEDILSLDGEISETGIGQDDLLISWLITAAPEKIILHKTDEFPPSLLQTIQGVFLARVEFCRGCEKCRDYSSIVGTVEKLKTTFKTNLDNIFK